MILDTNAFSALANGDPGLEPVLMRASSLFLPVIVLGEYRYGIAYSRQREHYAAWLMESIPNFRILEIDQDTTTHYAKVRGELKKAGTPFPSNDVWIAALCRQYSLPLISHDQHFDLVAGLNRLGW